MDSSGPVPSVWGGAAAAVGATHKDKCKMLRVEIVTPSYVQYFMHSGIGITKGATKEQDHT